jgi:subtilase family serine protease
MLGLGAIPLQAADDTAADHAMHQSGNPLPAPGYARPPFHITRNATTGPTGLTPTKVAKFYGIDQIANQGAGQTIAIVDAYDDPRIEADLGIFSTTFGLPTCTTSNGCFKKIYASGSKPTANAGWSLEMALDVEWVHAVAPQARIILVEAASNSFVNLMKAIDVAVKNGASVVSMSFGGSEFSSETSYDYHFNVPNVTFTASSGDSGYGVEYPAASPYVVAVGGTTMNLADATGAYGSETAWSGSGGGQSAYETQPNYQAGIPNSNGKRGVPDVAYGADPNIGFAVYDSVKYNGQSGWFQVGGTSAGAPQWAGLFAIANAIRLGTSMTPLTLPDADLYPAAGTAGNFHDVTSGTNGTCGSLCTAAPGYDDVTGLGSPVTSNLMSSLTQ